MVKKVLITTYPFGMNDKQPIDLLKAAGYDVYYNPYARKLTQVELIDIMLAINPDAIIAGTEKYKAHFFMDVPNLKCISRVGVGLDGIPFQACNDKNIKVAYTPEAPADSVAELTIGLILSLLRGIHTSNTDMHSGCWGRVLGKLVKDVTIGVMGMGRIGSRVATKLLGLTPNIMYTDPNVKDKTIEGFNILKVSENELLKECDLLTIHIPLNQKNYHCIDYKQLGMMKHGAFIVNTARGAIIQELALLSSLENQHLGGAAIDVFENEPYNGQLKDFDNVILTSHMASMTSSGRSRMEIEATENCIAMLNGKTPKDIVTQEIINELT